MKGKLKIKLKLNVQNYSQILDPPNSNLPPEIKKYTDKDNNDNNDENDTEKRNPINWGDEIPEGDLSAFIELGPNARVNHLKLNYYHTSLN